MVPVREYAMHDYGSVHTSTWTLHAWHTVCNMKARGSSLPPVVYTAVLLLCFAMDVPLMKYCTLYSSSSTAALLYSIEQVAQLLEVWE